MSSPPEPSPSGISAPAAVPPPLLSERSAVRIGGQEIALTPTQFRLLAALVAEPGRAFSRAELVARAIGTVVAERTVDVHVKELRRKLGPHGDRIETVRRRGYRWTDETPMSNG